MSKITTSLAKQLIKNYRDNKIGKETINDRTLGVWFSREDIMEILAEVNGVEPDGLRFHFAAYEDDRQGQEIPPVFDEDLGKITLVITATTNELDGNTNVPHPYRIGEILHYDILPDPETLPGYESDSSAPLTAINDGQSCPPPNSRFES